jgi:hypothetical protein
MKWNILTVNNPDKCMNPYSISFLRSWHSLSLSNSPPLLEQNVHRHVYKHPKTCKFPQWNKSRSHFHIHIPKIDLKFLPPIFIWFVVSFWYSSLPTKNICGLHFSPTQAAHPVHFTLSDLITLITSHKDHKPSHSSLQSIPQPPVMPSD